MRVWWERGGGPDGADRGLGFCENFLNGFENNEGGDGGEKEENFGEFFLL